MYESGFRPELPARVRIGRELAEKASQIAGGFDLPPEQRAREMNWGTAFFEAPPVAAQILGSDQAKVHSIARPEDVTAETGGDARITWVELHQNGSPYVPEEDFAVMQTPVTGNKPRSGYFVFTAEGPPVAVHEGHFYREGQQPDFGTVSGLMEVRGRNPHALHELTDQDCESLLRVVDASAPYAVFIEPL